MSQGAPSRAATMSIFKNNRGSVIGTYSFDVGISTALFAEISAVIQGIEYAHHCGWHRLRIELDYMVVIQFLQSSSYLLPCVLPQCGITASNFFLVCVSNIPTSIGRETQLQTVWC